jgi:hypothetical protein
VIFLGFSHGFSTSMEPALEAVAAATRRCFSCLKTWWILVVGGEQQTWGVQGIYGIWWGGTCNGNIESSRWLKYICVIKWGKNMGIPLIICLWGQVSGAGLSVYFLVLKITNASVRLEVVLLDPHKHELVVQYISSYWIGTPHMSKRPPGFLTWTRSKTHVGWVLLLAWWGF